MTEDDAAGAYIDTRLAFACVVWAYELNKTIPDSRSSLRESNRKQIEVLWTRLRAISGLDKERAGHNYSVLRDWLESSGK